MRTLKMLGMTLFGGLALAGCIVKGQGNSAEVAACSASPAAADCNTQRINTRGWEDSPYLTPDGKHLYFMYNPFNFFEMFFGGEIKKLGPDRPEFKTANPSDPWSSSNTYVSERLPGGGWSAPVRVPWDRTEGSCCAMPNGDGSAAYFQTGAAGGAPHQDIVYVQRQTDGSWSAPIYMGPEINTTGIEDNPHLRADGKMLFWTATRDDGLGGKDIWYSVLGADGRWSMAANVGDGINSSDDEDQMWVSQDGRTAYFNRGSTIMTSQFDGTRWSKAEEVKFATPVSGAEASLTADGKTMALAVIDVQRRDIVISLSQLGANGIWSTPVPVD